MTWTNALEIWRELWPHIGAAAVVLVDMTVTAHVVMYKKDSRSAIGWVGLIWLAPLVGVFLYGLLGINRVRRKAVRVRGPEPRRPTPNAVAHDCSLPKLREQLPEEARHMAALAHLVSELTDRPLLHGNSIRPLFDGDEAYPQMIAAIASAKQSVALATYIFNDDRAGRDFVAALADATARGVEVRVLIDDIGARYNFPSVVRLLRRRHVRTATFLPTFTPLWSPYANLRSHRKLLVVDGVLGFTGGLNIREGHLHRLNPEHPIRDMHFALRGPVVGQLQQVFVNDWAFCTGEALNDASWFPELQPAGTTVARGITTGPDTDLDKLRLTLLGALSTARKSVSIVTPYFLPDASLIMALGVAALRGVVVDIYLPRQNNLALVQWASTAQLWQVLQHGCNVWYSQPPFDHAKLMVVDGAWALIGSHNWDPRSLRLNFEFDVECYDPELATRLEEVIAQRRSISRPVTLKEVDSRSPPVRFRDGVARLFSPYL